MQGACLASRTLFGCGHSISVPWFSSSEHTDCAPCCCHPAPVPVLSCKMLSPGQDSLLLAGGSPLSVRSWRLLSLRCLLCWFLPHSALPGSRFSVPLSVEGLIFPEVVKCHLLPCYFVPQASWRDVAGTPACFVNICISSTCTYGRYVVGTQ